MSSLSITAYVNERGTVDAGERMGDPIRKRKLRVSPSARLIGVRVEYDERELVTKRGVAEALMKSRAVQEAFIVAGSGGLIDLKRHRVLDVEATRSAL